MIWVAAVAVLLDTIYSQSYLNIEELTSMKYGVEISNKPVIFQENPLENEVLLSSKFGQPYSCLLPRDVGVDEEHDNLGSSDKHSVVDLLDQSLNDTCLTHHLGWWSYKVCHKNKIEQYHMNDKSKVEGEITSLGIYESEDDWNSEEKLEGKFENRHHSQTYVNGTICDLTNKPRKTTVEYLCSPSGTNTIVRVEEPSTCEYKITIHSSALCEHSLFKKKEKSKQTTLVCSPVLQEKEYKKYMAKLQKDKEEKAKEKTKREEEMERKKQDDENTRKNKPIWKDAAKEVNKFMKGFLNLFTNTGGTGSNIKIPDITTGPLSSRKKQLSTTIEKEYGEVEENQSLKGEKKSLEESDSKQQKEKQNEKLNEKQNEVSIQKQKQKEELKETKRLTQKALDDIEKSKKLSEEIEELRKSNSKLYEQSRNMRKQIETQFEAAKKQNYAKLKETRESIMSLKRKSSQTESVEERKKIQKEMEILEKDFNERKRKLGKMHMWTKEMKQFEEQANSHIMKLNEQMKETEEIEKLFGKAFSEDETEEQKVADTMENIFKIANGKFAEIEKDIKEDDGENEGPDYGTEMKELFKQDDAKDEDELDTDLDEDDNPTLLDTEENDISNDNKRAGDTGGSNLVKLLEDKLKGLSEKLKVESEKLKSDLDEEVQEAVEETEKGFKDSMQVRVRQLDSDTDIEKEFEKIDEEVADEVKAATKKMEDAVKRQLKKAGLKLSDNIKVKIVTSKDGFDKMGKGKNANLLSDEQATDFKDLLLGFLGGKTEKIEEEKRQKVLEQNYMFNWSDGESNENNGNEANNEDIGGDRSEDETDPNKVTI